MRKVIDAARAAASSEQRSSSDDDDTEIQSQIAQLEYENHLLRKLIDRLQQQAATLH
jgi:hypothetical protein